MRGQVGLFGKDAVLLRRPEVSHELEGVAFEVATNLAAELALALLDGALHDVVVAGHIVVGPTVNHLGCGEQPAGVVEEAFLSVQPEGLFDSRGWVHPQP